MIIFLSIFCVFSVFLNDAYNAIRNQKYNYAIFPLFMLASVQLLVQTIVAVAGVNFVNTQILVYLLIFIEIAALLGCFLFTCIKYRISFADFKNRLIEIMKNNCMWYAGIVIFGIILLFQFNKFDDVGLYFSIANDFSAGVFTDNYSYISPASYYTYAVLATNGIPIWFNFFTPFIFYIIFVGFINSFLEMKLKDVKYKVWWFLCCHIFLLAFSIFITPTTISGNLYIPACLIAMVIIAILQKKYYLIPLGMLMTQFFSSTGTLISLIIAFSFLFYLLTYFNVRKVIHNFAGISIANIGFIFLVLNSGEANYADVMMSEWKNIILAGYLVWIATAIAIHGIYMWLLKSRSNKFLEFRLIDVQWANSKPTKWFLVVAAVLCSAFLAYYFTSVTEGRGNYSSGLLIAFYVLMLPMCIFNFIKDYDKEENYNLLLIVNTGLVSFIYVVSMLLGFNNSSFWRFMFVLPTIGIGESIFSAILIIALNILGIFNNIKGIPKINLFSMKIKHHERATSISISCIFSICAAIPFIVTATSPALTANTWSQYSPNIQKNLNLFTEKDANILTELNKTRAFINLKFAADNSVDAYLTMRNKTYDFYADMWLTEEGVKNPTSDKRSWAINRLNFYDIKYKWKKSADIKIQDQTLPQFESMFQEYLASNHWNSIVDLVFLSRETPYYASLNLKEFAYCNTTTFEEFIVIAKNEENLKLFNL